MATPRQSGPVAGDSEPWVVRLVRNFDLAILALALPVFLLAELPVLGWAAAGVGWLCQRLIRAALEQRAAATDDPRTAAGITAGSMLARAWILALTVFGVGIADGDETGLAAAVLVIVLFTAFFSAQLALRPVDRAVR